MTALAMATMPFSISPELKSRLKYICFILACLLFLSPSVIVLADGFGGLDTQELIGVAGADDSQLLIGNSGTSNNELDIQMGQSGAHFHADDPAFLIVSLLPLLYILLSIVLLVGMFKSGAGAETIILATVLIYVGLVFLEGIQELVTGLLT